VSSGTAHLLAGTPFARLLDYAEITKPGLTSLAVATAAVAAYLAGPPSVSVFAGTMAGTFLLGSGAVGLNQVIERQKDAVMPRTRRRPLPAGRLSVRNALLFSIVLVVLGLALLFAATTVPAGVLGVVTLLTYAGVYTPLKTRTHLATLVGGVPGALPPVIGWAAVRGELGLEPFILFSILYLWQIPHFLALAWLYRGDYRRAGYKMLPLHDRAGAATSRLVLLYCATLIPASILPTLLGMAGIIPAVGGALAAAVFTISGALFQADRSDRRARNLFLSSLIYLPTLFGLLLADRLLLRLLSES
jgi:protoheme IX farnesyltransferase